MWKWSASPAEWLIQQIKGHFSILGTMCGSLTGEEASYHSHFLCVTPQLSENTPICWISTFYMGTNTNPYTHTHKHCYLHCWRIPINWFPGTLPWCSLVAERDNVAEVYGSERTRYWRHRSESSEETGTGKGASFCRLVKAHFTCVCVYFCLSGCCRQKKKKVV